MVEKVKTNKALRTDTGRTQPAAKKVAKKAAPKSGRTAKGDGRRSFEGWLDGVKPELQPLGRRLDQLILEAMPDAVCAVKWNVPFYGLPGQGWIAALNSFKAHVKLLFFAGNALKPMPPAGKGHSNRLSLERGTRREQEAGQGVAEAGKGAPGLGPQAP